MNQISIIGMEIRTLRKAVGESLAETAKAIGVDRTHLNKIELGNYKPSFELLQLIIAHFSVDGSQASQLRLLLREPPVERLVVGLENERRTDNMQKDAQTETPQQVTINPAQTPVLYTDSTFVSSTEYGLVLDVAQALPGNQHNVVSRIGMSFDHAKKLVEIIHDHLQKNER